MEFVNGKDDIPSIWNIWNGIHSCSKRSKPPTSYSCMMLYVDQVTIEILDLPIQNGWNFCLVGGAITILKNDGVRQWKGWHPQHMKYMKWKIIHSCSKRSKPPTSYSCMMLYVDQVTIEILDLPIQNGWSFCLVGGAITILKNDGVRQWKGWHPQHMKYMKWNPFMFQTFQTTNQL